MNNNSIPRNPRQYQTNSPPQYGGRYEVHNDDEHFEGNNNTINPNNNNSNKSGDVAPRSLFGTLFRTLKLYIICPFTICLSGSLGVCLGFAIFSFLEKRYFFW